MSLFKLREYWSAKCGDGEEFDKYSVAVGNFDHAPDKLEKLAVGSLNGILRVFAPKERGFQPADVMLEQNLGQPILDIIFGKLHSSKASLGILTPRRFICCTVVSKGQAPSELEEAHTTGNVNPNYEADPLAMGVFALNILYTINFNRTAYNMCCGSFGHRGQATPSSRDILAIQSVDGQISFYDGGSHTMSRFIPGNLVPGPLTYCFRSDSLVTALSTYEIQAYAFTVLAAAAGAETKQEDGVPSGAHSGKMLTAEWKFNAGEVISDICAGKVTRAEGANANVIALGERTLFILTDGGRLLSQRRLDFVPLSICTTFVPLDNAVNVLIGTTTGTIHVYSETTQVWTAKAPRAALTLNIFEMADCKGMIVLLTEDGALSVNFLGSDPASKPAAVPTGKAPDYAAMEAESRELQAIIKASKNQGKVADPLTLKATVWQAVEASGWNEAAGARKVPVSCYMQYKGSENLHNLNVSIQLPPFLSTPNPLFDVPVLYGSGGVDSSSSAPHSIKFEVFCARDSGLFPGAFGGTIIVNYQSVTGEQKVSKANFFVPVGLVATLVKPPKALPVKVTLACSDSPPNLDEMFCGRFDGPAAIQSNAFGVCLHGVSSEQATIVLSKSSSRVRISATSFPALWVLLREYVAEMRQVAPTITLTLDENIAVGEYFDHIERHFETRCTLAKAEKVLSDRAGQFRAAQKRLLVRFKDPNPAPLQNFDFVFESSYESVMVAAEAVEQGQQNLLIQCTALSASTHVLIALVKLKFGLSTEAVTMLRSHLSPIVNDDIAVAGCGWEETTAAALLNLLRTTLARTARERQQAAVPLELARDTKKVKRRIQDVLERLQQGVDLTGDRSLEIVTKDGTGNAAGDASPDTVPPPSGVPVEQPPTHVLPEES